MTIVKTATLTPLQQSQIETLQTAAYKKHKLQNLAFLSNDINFDRQLPCFFLGYVGEQLVAFLTLFMPTRTEAEVTAFTHPDYQNKGCFGLLLDEAIAVLRRVRIRELLFAVEPQSRSAAAVLRTLGCSTLVRSEYRMRAASLRDVPDCGALQMFEVDQSNRQLFRAAVAAVYPKERDMDNFYDSVVSTDLRHGYILYSDRPIGIFSLGLEHGDSMLYGVGIAPEYRGKGYGKQLMGHAMREGFRFAKSMSLDVDSNNPVAYHLYLKCGFKVEFQVDYYSYKF